MQYLVMLVASIWLLVSGFWLITLAGIGALLLTPNFFAIYALPVVFFLDYVIKYTTCNSDWKSYILSFCVVIYAILGISILGYCVLRFIVIPGEISIPAIFFGFFIATKCLSTFARIDLESGNYNVFCLAIFSQVAFISSVIMIAKLQKINEPIILSYLITGLIAVIALIVVWPMGKGYSELEVAKMILKNF